MERTPPSATITAQVKLRFQQALAHQRAGQLAQAHRSYRQVLKMQPKHAGALHLLGMLTLQADDPAGARDLIKRSLAIDASKAEAHSDLGSALDALGKKVDALSSYERALALNPNLVVALFNKAALLHELTWYEQALEAHDRVIELQPGMAAAHYNRGLSLAALGRRTQAVASYDRCLGIASCHIEALNNRGIALLELGRPSDALTDFECVLRLAPTSVQGLNNRGNALRSLYRAAEAVESFNSALALEPRFIDALRNRGGAEREAGQLHAALSTFRSALSLAEGCRDSLLQCAEICIELQNYAEAASFLERLTAVAPGVDYVQGLALHLKRLQCDWTGFAAATSALVAAVRAEGRADYPFLFLAVSDSGIAQLRCAGAFGQDKFPAVDARLWNGEIYTHDKIRVAYLSGDLRSHAVAMLMIGVLERHDQSQFEIVCVSFHAPENSPLGQRIGHAYAEFIDVSGMSDRDVALLLRRKEIDIAVDLTGFTKGCRTSIFAHRAVPAQINYLGFPGTLGMPYIDYIIADKFVIPAGQSQNYNEQVIYLPDCFQANDDRRGRPSETTPRGRLALPDTSFVFCCFNNVYKLNPECFKRWLRVLDAVPDAVLWLLSESAVVTHNLRHAAQDGGINKDRLMFAPRVAYAEHLARLPAADLFLDTVPFNGGATISDALWCGLPVLTCAGEAFASRMAGSLLRACGLPELVTTDLDDYQALAVDLARDRQRLTALRSRLAEHRDSCPLFDTERFCRHLESAYSLVRDRTRRCEAPGALAVPAVPPGDRREWLPDQGAVP